MATAVLIPMTDVESSLLKQLGHDAETFILSARFLPGKKSPAGKVYHYQDVSEEVFDDVINPKGGLSVGEAFSRIIKAHPELYPCTCVDEGIIADGIQEPKAEILPPVIPDDEEGLKNLAIATRAEATALTITTAEECEAASIEVLRIRTERKLAIEKVDRIKIPATQVWKAACALYNEIDGRYAEAEKYLDGGILAYRAKERQRVAEENAAFHRQQTEAREKAEREQREEHQRQQKAAEEEAAQASKQLAEEDAKAAEAQGMSAEAVQQIRENPLQLTARHVAPPPIAYAPAPLALSQQNVPKVQGLSFTTEWFYTITDERLIPLSHEFYSLDPKKINAKVQSLKNHANIPGVHVDSREAPIKRTARA